MNAAIQKLKVKVKQKFCRHVFGQLIIDEQKRQATPFLPAELIHPVDKTKIPVLKRDYTGKRICYCCGKKIVIHGYDAKTKGETE